MAASALEPWRTKWAVTALPCAPGLPWRRAIKENFHLSPPQAAEFLQAGDEFLLHHPGNPAAARVWGSGYGRQSSKALSENSTASFMIM